MRAKMVGNLCFVMDVQGPFTKECFDPIVDTETGRDLFHLWFMGIIRIFGQDIAELPLAATRMGNQRKDLKRRRCIELKRDRKIPIRFTLGFPKCTPWENQRASHKLDYWWCLLMGGLLPGKKEHNSSAGPWKSWCTGGGTENFRLSSCILGAQDTLDDDRGRHYFKECFIQGS
ncbi:unnamed protein product [Fraxinus pennsylvanica]|uniref:Pectinesterase n=1 Tax=Fraxinus pennsylvanica TaxID=56036 RepID=A0AAD1Z3E5_9LAMI|nr:unnamed protein product [Fraxinus pennsylvanica]